LCLSLQQEHRYPHASNPARNLQSSPVPVHNPPPYSHDHSCTDCSTVASNPTPSCPPHQTRTNPQPGTQQPGHSKKHNINASLIPNCHYQKRVSRHSPTNRPCSHNLGSQTIVLRVSDSHTLSQVNSQKQTRHVSPKRLQCHHFQTRANAETSTRARTLYASPSLPERKGRAGGREPRGHGQGSG
jgi:hypothetical protein